jgi:predicted anti-sigma-YlaC factor YlaD
MNRHLSSEDFSEWLLGQPTPECEEHLRTCAGCAAELDKIQAPLGLFREAVREWSANEERRSVAMPARSRSGLLWVRVAATAVALAILIAIGIGGQNRRAAGIEREDEMLLGQVQAAVSRPVPATMQPVYDLMVEEGAK